MVANYVEDGNQAFLSGQDAYHAPHLIKPDGYQKGINLSARHGRIGPRDGFQRLELIFEDETVRNRFYQQIPVSQIFQSGKFQAMIPYTSNGDSYLLFVISGMIFRLNVRRMTVILMSQDVRINQFVARANWSLAGRFIVIFDYPDYPIIIDGETVRRADPKKYEVPISVLGAYNQNRLFIANDGNAFTAGDPTGSLATPNAPITFTEILVPATGFTGQSFTLGTQNTNQSITAMGFLQVIDQNTGLGPLFVATENSMYLYQTDQPRSVWEQIEFGNLLLFNAGVVGPRAVVNVNSDLIFLSAEGKVHALSMSRNDSKRWGNIPISREVENWLIYHDPSLKKVAFLAYFDNRIYIAANPYRVDALTLDQERVTDYAHGGMAVLEMDTIASLQADQTPVWAGLWTGIRPMDMQNIGDRCFIISKDSTRINHVYELMKDTPFDIVDGKERNVRSILYTREYEFGNPHNTKQEQAITVVIDNIQGDFSLLVDRKPSHMANYTRYGEWRHIAPYEQCGIPDCLEGYAPHSFREMIMGAPNDAVCDPVTQDTAAYFRRYQMRFTLEGRNWSFEHLKIRAVEKPSDDRNTLCTDLKQIPICKDCEPDWINNDDTGCNR